jgi:hypothetical protein
VVVIVTNLQAGQFDCELTYGQCQIFLQSSEGYDPLHTKQGTRALPQQIAVDYCLQVFEQSTHAVARHIWRCFLGKPSASFPKLSLTDCRQCGQFVLAHPGLAKKLMPLDGGYTYSYFCQEQYANSLSYEPKALMQKLFRTVLGALSSYLAYLTNLTVHYQSCLLSSVHQYRVFQSKVRSFGSPVGGL